MENDSARILKLWKRGLGTMGYGTDGGLFVA
jgi:hypothetical protein